jgi:CheY-like chemotaxis protein
MPYGKILVVDDLDANVYVARGFLAPYGLEVDSADSGYDAIRKIEGGAVYDLILMDHMMPQMDGIETVKRLRKMGYNEPIVAFTANAIIGQEEVFMRQGFDGFASKPIQSTHLNDVLNKFVRDKQPPELIEAAKEMAGDIFAKISISQVSHTELCRDFAKSQKNIMPEMQRALEANDFKTAHLLAHTLKSLAGLIGENNLATLAADAEKAFRSAETICLNSLTTEVENVLTKLNAIYKDTPAPPLTTDTREIAKLLNKLEAFLQQSNAEAINLLPQLRTIPNTQDIITQIENYNFECALVSLINLKSKGENTGS